MIQPDNRDINKSVWLNQKDTWHPQQPIKENYYTEDLNYDACPRCDQYSNLAQYGTTWNRGPSNAFAGTKYCGGTVSQIIAPKPAVDFPAIFNRFDRNPPWFTVLPGKNGPIEPPVIQKHCNGGILGYSTYHMN